MYTVELPGFLIQCPVYWVNFITDLSMKTEHKGDVPLNVLNEVLAEYNATWIEEHGDDYERCAVNFKTEADLMWFKLKWQ